MIKKHWLPNGLAKDESSSITTVIEPKTMSNTTETTAHSQSSTPQNFTSADQLSSEPSVLVSSITIPNSIPDKVSPAPQPVSSTNSDSKQPSSQVQDGMLSENVQEAPYSIHSMWEKRWIIIGGSIAAFFSPMTQQIYFPALTSIAKEFNVSDTKANLTITTYMIFQGLTPMFMGNFADTAGRRPAYMMCFLIFISANIGLALAPNYAAMLVLRCIQAAGSSTTVALSFAVISDIVTSAERGRFVGLTSLPIVLAPAIGPVLGGVISQYLGWRAIFWFLAILAGVFIVPFMLIMPETARHLVGDGSIIPPRFNQTGVALLKTAINTHKTRTDLEHGDATMEAKPERRKLFWPNPMPTLRLMVDKELSLILISSSAVFAGFYMLTSSIPSEFTKNYGFNEAQTGLMYLPLAAGSTVASYGMGYLMDKNYARHCKRLGRPYQQLKQESLENFPIERVRYEVGIPLLLLATLSHFSWGWALYKKAHIAVMCILMFLFGVGIIGFNNTTNAIIVDINRKQAASAAAANNIARCLVGAGATAAIVPLIDKIGAGWTFTIIGGLYILAFIPSFFVIARGMRWRGEKADKLRVEQEKAEHSMEQSEEDIIKAHEAQDVYMDNAEKA